MPEFRTTRRQFGAAALIGAGIALAPSSLRLALAQDATPASGATPVEEPAVEITGKAIALEPGTRTAQRAFIVAEDPSTLEIIPLITSGEMVGDYQFAGTPDGMGLYLDGTDAILFVNHEWVPMVEGSDEGNLRGGMVSRLVLDPATGAVKSGSYPVKGDEGYWDLCSATLFDQMNGFSKPVFVSGEETPEGPMGGVAFGLDAATGEIIPMPWLGYLAHENQVPIPAWGDKKVILVCDDNSDGSEAYLFVAESEADLFAGKGTLHVFVADGATGTADVVKGKELTGTFVPLAPEANADAPTLQAAAESAGAFTFVRMEDADYDRNTPNVVYFADTGDDGEPNLAADGSPLSLNGRIYKMTFDVVDPTVVTSLTVVVDGDDGDDIKNPDNIGASASKVIILEDRNGYNRSESDDTARAFAYDPVTGSLTQIAHIDQSEGDGVVDAGIKAGEWEMSGVIDASHVFGPGTWLINVQAHTRMTEQFDGVDQGGQILLLREK